MDQQEAMRAINKLIYQKRSNTVLSHLKTWVEGNEDRYHGNINGLQFEIWRFTRGAQGFHPVISGKISENEKGDVAIDLKPFLNPLGMLQSILGTIGMVIFSVMILPKGISFWLSFLLAFSCVLLIAGIVFFVYNYETKYHLTQLKEKINQELNH